MTDPHPPRPLTEAAATYARDRSGDAGHEFCCGQTKETT